MSNAVAMQLLPNLQPNLFDRVEPHTRFLPQITVLDDGPPTHRVWDIPSTITELSYLTHNHYRYYGKFPSVVAGQLLEEQPPTRREDYVFDNFCGSGTTLVEAKIRNIASRGVDISWLSAMASNVKVHPVDLAKIDKMATTILSYTNDMQIDDDLPPDISKWFPPENANELLRLRCALSQFDRCPELDFLYVAFLGIIRRVSWAYDAEVRPHFNKDKKPRNVISAFKKKLKDMAERHAEFEDLTDPNVVAECEVGSADSIDAFRDIPPYLVISHPPYLNAFNYVPVYRLEYFWGEKYRPVNADDYKILSRRELRVHPASDKNIEEYFRYLRSTYGRIADCQEKGARIAVVIGDCTRNGEIIRVVDRMIDELSSTELQLVQRNSRTTHYGLGKYAYKNRADYHGERANKEDAILVFERK